MKGWYYLKLRPSGSNEEEETWLNLDKVIAFARHPEDKNQSVIVSELGTYAYVDQELHTLMSDIAATQEL